MTKNRESGEHCIVGYGVLHLFYTAHFGKCSRSYRKFTYYAQNAYSIAKIVCYFEQCLHICLCDDNESALKHYECSYYITPMHLHFNRN